MVRVISVSLAVLLLLAPVVNPTVTSDTPPREDTRTRSQGSHHDGHHDGDYMVGSGDDLRHNSYTNRGHVGEIRPWPAVRWEAQDAPFDFYLKDFVLRGIGPHVEVWTPVGDAISTGLGFPAGDCRNGDERTVVTDEQVAFLIQEYEDKILPVASEHFGQPAVRNGKDATLLQFEPWLPRDVYRGPGHRLVVLVDTFRTPAFFDINEHVSFSGLASPLQMQLTDRNIANVRGTGWAWRLGDDVRAPIDSEDPCVRIYGAPNQIQSILGHEYTHVLQSGLAGPDGSGMLWRDPKWITEGLATWSQELYGYEDFASSDPDRNYAALCFLGHLFNAEYAGHLCSGGPENSLILWDEPHDSLTDYGAAALFFKFLEGRYGRSFVESFHCVECGQGSDKVDTLLARDGIPTTFNALVEDWAVSLAVDGWLDVGANLVDDDPGRFQASLLHTSVAWESPLAVQAPGIGPMASDYLLPRHPDGRPIAPSEFDSITFEANRFVDAWAIAPRGHGPGNPAFYSGVPANLQDRLLSTRITVPPENPILRFDARYDIEALWDFAYVQVSDDGGVTWRSVPTTSTTTDHQPGAAPWIVADLPGLTGASGGWRTETADLSEWAGKTVELGFRYRTDTFVLGPGIWIDNIRIGSTLVSDASDLEGWSRNLPAVDLVLRLVSLNEDSGDLSVRELPLDDHDAGAWQADEIQAALAPGATFAGFIATHLQYSYGSPIRYHLVVNGVSQGGG
jgi:hypothetical protein